MLIAVFQISKSWFVAKGYSITKRWRTWFFSNSQCCQKTRTLFSWAKLLIYDRVRSSNIHSNSCYHAVPYDINIHWRHWFVDIWYFIRNEIVHSISNINWNKLEMYKYILVLILDRNEIQSEKLSKIHCVVRDAMMLWKNSCTNYMLWYVLRKQEQHAWSNTFHILTYPHYFQWK